MDNQGRKQFLGPFWIEFDKLQPGPDVLDMGGVNPHLPVIAHTPKVRRLKPEVYDRVHKEVHEITLIRLVYGFSHIENAVEGGARVFQDALLQNIKGLPDQWLQILGLLLIYEPCKGPVDISQCLFMD